MFSLSIILDWKKSLKGNSLKRGVWMAGTTITEVLKGMKCYAESYVGKNKFSNSKTLDM